MIRDLQQVTVHQGPLSYTYYQCRSERGPTWVNLDYTFRLPLCGRVCLHVI